MEFSLASESQDEIYTFNHTANDNYSTLGVLPSLELSAFF